MKAPAARPPFSRELIDLLLLGVFFVAAPHVFNLDAGITAFFAACVLWRFAANRRPEWGPKPIALFLVTLAGGAVVFLLYHRFYGREPGAALFLVGLGLKLLEMKGRRDIFLVVYLAFFVALTQYLFSQSIPMAAYTLAAVTLLVAVLLAMAGDPVLGMRDAVKRSAALVGQALPLMVVLFVFFPRIQGPLWTLPDESNAANTGLSDTIQPGSVSRLGQSYEAAFRVDFLGTPPPNSALYWRGPVFWRTDGRTWTLSRDNPILPRHKPRLAGIAYDYLITLEPHQRNWVFALDVPDDFPDELSQTADYRLISRDKISERTQFRLRSHIDYRGGDLTTDEWRAGLQLPGEPSPRIRQLVDRWIAAGADEPPELADAALRHFRSESFVYTLNPPPLGKDPVENFLFETRKGFCEHYATAFVYLMRVAGVPARVVTGYQGGQWNPMGNFLEVRQADAHAWAEIWLPGRGWTRVDPTAAVAPERIERGVDVERQTEAGEVSFNGLASEMAGRSRGIQDWLRRGRMAWASIDHAWNLWVLAYDPKTQRHFWESLGIVDWWKLSLWLIGLSSVAGAAAFFLFQPRRWEKLDASLAVYRKFLKRLERRGIAPKPGEGPRDFGARAAQARPEAQDAIARITALFLRIRYGRDPQPADLTQLRQLIRKFRP